MENIKLFILGFIAFITVAIFCFTADTNLYIRHNIVNKAELDSILDARLGSGCDLYVDSCDIYTE